MIFCEFKLLVVFLLRKVFYICFKGEYSKVFLINCYDKYLNIGFCYGWEKIDLMRLFVWVYLYLLFKFLFWEEFVI